MPSVEYNSLNYMESAMAPSELHYKCQVLGATWGHLAPKKNKTYKGTILFCQTEYGEYTVISSDFKGLPDSPWLYEALNEFVSHNAEKHGVIYQFIGTFKNYEFNGSIVKIPVPIPK